DVASGAITRVSLNTGGGQAFGGDSGVDGYWAQPSISNDGRYVAFTSAAVNLVPFDSNDITDVFVRDRVGDTTGRARPGAAREEGDGLSTQPAISGNGRYVSFRSHATNFVAGDTNGFDDIFVKDLVTGAIERVSVSSGGVQANADCWRSAISADGRYVVFET